MRVYELAKELGMALSELKEKLAELKISIKSHLSSLSESEVKKVKEALLKPKEELPPKRRRVRQREPEEKKITIMEGITVGELAKKMKHDPVDVIKKMMFLGEMATITTRLNEEIASKVAQEFGYKTRTVQEYGDDILEEIIQKTSGKEAPRAPVVTVMGHVNHGKTLLLDVIRKTNVAAKETGGITQHIGAYEVELPKGKITFLDTPGHEVFTSMRARGAKVTDLVILVVAADEGVMPQTVEAIDHAKAAGVPILVAINKMDKPTADPEKVKHQLSKYDLVPEEWGGKTIFVEVSAKEKLGIDELLEMVLLEAEMLELKADYEKPAVGVVIESRLDKGYGNIATVLLKEGKLRIGDVFLTGRFSGRVRALINDKLKRVSEAGPSTPIEVLGIDGLPEVGDKFIVLPDERMAKQIAQKRQELQRVKSLQKPHHITLSEFHARAVAEKIKELKIIIKTDVSGSLEAITKSLNSLSTPEVKVNILHGGSGAINESDVLLAAASDAIILGFGVRVQTEAAKLAEREGVDIKLYQVIYELIGEVKSALEGLLEPERKEIFLGEAEVKNLFRISNVGIVAGCAIKRGKMVSGERVRVFRNNVITYEGKLETLKRFKETVKEVGEGLECGIKIENYDDVKIEDIIECYTIEEKAKKL
jgi:translation initiation factor IF-2